jgi:hypothetical protein
VVLADGEAGQAPRRQVQHRPWSPWRAIEAATDFFDTFQPASTRSSHTQGDP